MSNTPNSSQDATTHEDFSYASIQADAKAKPQVSFTLSLNNAVFSYDPASATPAHLTVELTFYATVTPPVVLEFFSYQRFDIDIIDDAGNVVYLWSAGRAFPMIASNISVFGKEHWTVDVTLADQNGSPLPAGHYIAQSYLVNHTDIDTRNPEAFSRKYAASVEFSIQNLQESSSSSN